MEPVETNKPQRSFVKPLLIGLGLFFVAVIALAGTVLGVAYEKINIKKPALEQKIRHGVMSIAFMPKTTTYVLEKAVKANEGIKQMNVDMSFAITAEQFRKALGTDQFDVIVKGPMDIQDETNPTSQLNVSITKDFNMDMITMKDGSYFKFNKLPNALIKQYVPLEDEHIAVLQDKWIMQEDKSLESEARKEAQAYKNKETPNEKKARQKITAYFEKNVLPKATMQKAQLDRKEMYKINIPVTQKDIDYIQKTMDDVKTQSDVDMPAKDNSTDNIIVDDFNVDVWVDAKDYYAQKTVFATKLREKKNTAAQTPNAPLPFDRFFSENVSIVGVVNISDINKAVTIEKPSKTYTSEELMKELEKEARKTPVRRRAF